MALNTFGWTPSEVTTDSAGNVISGVTLTVFTDVTKASQVTTLFDKDGVTALASGVVVSDNKGRFGFKASDTYSMLYVYDGSTADPWPIAAHEALDQGMASHAAAVTAAQNAANSAAASANLVNAPADSAIAAAVNGAGTQTRAALNSTYGAQVGIARLRGPAPIVTMVSACTTGHGWLNGGNYNAGASWANDNTDYLIGTQSVKLVSNGDGLYHMIYKTGLALDFTGRNVRLWIKYDSETQCKQIQLLLGDATMANYFQANLVNLNGITDTRNQPVKPGEWTVVDVPWSAFTFTQGAPSRASITQVRLNCYDKGVPSTVRFGGIASTAASTDYPNGVVTLSFDDSFASIYTKAFPYLSARGLVGTAFPIQSRVDAPGYVTTAQLRTLQDAGWDIGAHASTSTTHDQALTGMTDAERDTEMRAIRTWMAARGFRSGSFAYPIGYYDRPSERVLQAFFDSSRTAGNGGSTVRPTNTHRIGADNGGVQTVASIQAGILAAKTNGTRYDIVFHDIKDSGASGNDVSTANFQAIVDYIVTQGVAVRTHTQALAGA